MLDKMFVKCQLDKMATEIDEGDVDYILVKIDAKKIARGWIDAIELWATSFLSLQFAIFVDIAIAA